MRRFPLAALLAICLLIAACTESELSVDTSAPQASTQTSSVATTSSTTTTTPTTSTTTMLTPTLTFAEQEPPPEFTEFTSSTACDPEAEDANLQVIQAFVTAYNDRDESRLAELVRPDSPIADMSGIPHLGEDDWTDISAWATKGWSVDDHFELTRLVMYDSGSVFDLVRSNDVLRSNGIESLRHDGKVHSSRCSISRMVLYLPVVDLTSSECLFWNAFEDALAEGTTQEIFKPEACSE